MRYSLVSRFRGTLLGALIGKNLSHRTQIHESVDWVDIVTGGSRSLIERGRFDLDDWINQKQEFTNLNLKDSLLGEAILVTLPVALFFHENTAKLRQSLLKVVEIWENDPVVRDGTLVVGYAIALALTEKLSPTTFIEQAVSFVGETSTTLPQQLLKVNNLLTQFAGLERANVELRSPLKLEQDIAIAFYCFLSTLSDFRLSVRRADLLGALVCEITGALSGAYNTTAGIPVTWQLGVQTNVQLPMTNFKQMLKLADELVDVWSGVYDAENKGEYSRHVSAAPHVLRLR